MTFALVMTMGCVQTSSTRIPPHVSPLEARGVLVSAGVSVDSTTTDTVRARSVAAARSDTTTLALAFAVALTRELKNGVMIALPKTRWDSLVVAALREVRPASFRPLADSVHAMVVGTDALVFRGNSATVGAWESQCRTSSDGPLNWYLGESDYVFVKQSTGSWRLLERRIGRITDGRCNP
jgi:hypothetical protein